MIAITGQNQTKVLESAQRRPSRPRGRLVACCGIYLAAAAFGGTVTIASSRDVTSGTDAQRFFEVQNGCVELANIGANGNDGVELVAGGILPPSGRPAASRQDIVVQHNEGSQCATRNLSALFEAIKIVESGGDAQSVGDAGRSRGAYQISLRYWIDGGGDPAAYHRDVLNENECRAVMTRYWRRYCPLALASSDWQTLARVHNGGPRGAEKQSTLIYWLKVKDEMENVK